MNNITSMQFLNMILFLLRVWLVPMTVLKLDTVMRLTKKKKIYIKNTKY